MLLLKQIDDNLYLVDTEAEIREENYFYSNFKGEERILKFNHQVIPFPKDKKILAQLKDQLSGVTLFPLPEEKVDVEKLAGDYSDKNSSRGINYEGTNKGFIAGYSRCLSDNKERKYTEADIRAAFLQGRNSMFSSKSSNGLIELNEYIQSITTPNLQQYDGKEVEIETHEKQAGEGWTFTEQRFTPEGKLIIKLK